MTRFEFVRDPEPSLALVRRILRDSKAWEWALSKSTHDLEAHVRREDKVGTILVLFFLLFPMDFGDQPARVLALFTWVAILLLVCRRRLVAALIGLPTVWLASAFFFEGTPWEVQPARVLSLYLVVVLSYGLFDRSRERNRDNPQLSEEEQELEVHRVVDFAWPYGRGVLVVDGQAIQEEAGGKTRRVNPEDFLEGWSSEHGLALAFRNSDLPVIILPHPHPALRPALESALGQKLNDV